MSPNAFSAHLPPHSPPGEACRRPVILVLMGAYWPGSESTGPNLSLKELCLALAGHFQFLLLARDRPFGATYPAVTSGRWIDQGFAGARYCAISKTGAEGLREILCDTPHDLLWLNGFFDREFTLPALVLRRLGQIPRKPMLLSPRGEMATGALELKSGRKSAWVAVARRTGLLTDVWLHATGPREHRDIAARFPWSKGIIEAPNVRAMIAPHAGTSDDRAGSGVCRLAFIGRIARVKNLDYALAALRSVTAKVAFNIYGPVSDFEYWTECRQLIAALPDNVRVNHKGEIANENVPKILAGTDMLFLPTKGENFGHAIFEALACGVPVLVSDQTPWQDLEKSRAGWSLPLAEMSRFTSVIDEFAEMTADQRVNVACGARGVAERWHSSCDAAAASRVMFGISLRPTMPLLSERSLDRTCIGEKTRLSIVASHPIQYYVPLYRALASSISLEVHVIYCSRIGLDKKFDPQMGVEIAWNMDLLGGYSHEFLPEATRINQAGLFEINNPSVKSALIRTRPKVVILHGYGMMTMLRALAWCRMSRVPAIMTSDSSTHSSRPGARRKLKLTTLPLLLRQYSAFLTMSERSEDYLASLSVPREIMFRVPMMVSEHFWSIREGRAEIRKALRQKLELNEFDLVLLYVGKLYPGKRVEDVFKAMQRLAEARIKLLIIGDGEQRAQLEMNAKAAKLPVQFCGFINIDELPQYYCAADVLVHPAELEQFGMVVLEAAILGLPLILSDRIGAIGSTSIAKPGVNAIVYPCGDVSALAAAIDRLLNEPVVRARMQGQSLRISTEHIGTESVAGTISAIKYTLRQHGSTDAGNHDQPCSRTTRR